MQGRSTTGAILSAIQDWHGHLDKGADVQAVFFDLRKAFDSVPHGPLMDKLISLKFWCPGSPAIFITENSKWECLESILIPPV